MTGRDAWLAAEAGRLVDELHKHGVSVDFEYAYEAVSWEAIEDAWAEPAIRASLRSRSNPCRRGHPHSSACADLLPDCASPEPE